MSSFRGFYRFLWRTFEIAIALVAVWALYVAIEGNNLSRKAAENSNIASSWQIISTPGVGNTGKRDALELLNSEGFDLSGIDLSCEAMAGEGHWNENLSKCEKTILLDNLDISNADGEIKELFALNFSGSQMRR